jgi:hypothetical protein
MKYKLENILRSMFDLSYIAQGRGGLGSMVSWLIRVVIYDICVTSISEIFGVSRLVALFIFLAILGLVSFGGYVLKQRMSPGVDE